MNTIQNILDFDRNLKDCFNKAAEVLKLNTNFIADGTGLSRPTSSKSI